VTEAHQTTRVLAVRSDCGYDYARPVVRSDSGVLGVRSDYVGSAV